MPPLFLFVIVPKLADESLGILSIDFWGRCGIIQPSVNWRHARNLENMNKLLIFY
jgi:hypothetical protein